MRHLRHANRNPVTPNAGVASLGWTGHVGLEQLRAGLAWVYVEYIEEVPEPHRGAYLAAEKEARAAAAGLWSGRERMAPWGVAEGGKGGTTS
jgi:endonuclease YncB( thermonuclease family)